VGARHIVGVDAAMLAHPGAVGERGTLAGRARDSLAVGSPAGENARSAHPTRSPRESFTRAVLPCWRDAGLHISARRCLCPDAIVILDREQGADANLAERGITLHALFTATDLGVTEVDKQPIE